MPKIITIEGIDGCGKETQTKLLVDHLREEGHAVKTLRFPRYEEPTGDLIGRILQLDIEDPAGILPYMIPAWFISDRVDAQPEIKEWISQGGIWVLDRYTESNPVYQSVSFPEEKREEMIKWFYDLEAKYLNIVPSDLVLLLDLPPEIAHRVLRERAASEIVAATGVYASTDIYESAPARQLEVHKTYSLAAKIYGWDVVNCMSEDGDRRLTEKEVSERVWEVVRENL